ncbi:hypothetical protein JNK13_11915 [bacterium]|nr:hypothetical protein [bacterium]
MTGGTLVLKRKNSRCRVVKFFSTRSSKTFKKFPQGDYELSVISNSGCHKKISKKLRLRSNRSRFVKIKADVCPVSLNAEVQLPSCDGASRPLILYPNITYRVTGLQVRNCPLQIEAGAKIKIDPDAQLDLKRDLVISPRANLSADPIFVATAHEDRWWYTPLILRKYQTIYFEWFGGGYCQVGSGAVCDYADSSQAMQFAVNALTSGGTLSTFQNSPVASHYINLKKNVIIARNNITIDLNNSFIHNDNSTTRFICDGDRNPSLDLNDLNHRVEGYLQALFPDDLPLAIEQRWERAISNCQIREVQFGLPNLNLSPAQLSSNKSGIANFRWVKHGLAEDITRLGPGSSGLTLQVCRDCVARRIQIRGSQDGYFIYAHGRYNWTANMIAILVHLSENTRIEDLYIADAPLFAGIQVKGGKNNTIINSTVENLIEPINKWRLKNPLNPSSGLERIPTNDLGEYLDYANPPNVVGINYGSRVAFWDRGDSPYQTPQADPARLPKFSYPYLGSGYAFADLRRASRNTVWQNLSVLNAPAYSAFSSTESFASQYFNLYAQNVNNGMVFNRQGSTLVGGESGHQIQHINFHNMISNGIYLKVEATAEADMSILATAHAGNNYISRLQPNSGCIRFAPGVLASVFVGFENIDCH